MEEIVKIIDINNKYRLTVTKEFRKGEWSWFVDGQEKILFIWMRSGWFTGESGAYRVEYYDNYEDALDEAVRIKERFLEGVN